MLDPYAIAAAAAPAAAASDGAWLVGGAVRDTLLHRLCDDVDLVVAGDAEAFARTLADALGGSAFSFSDHSGTKTPMDMCFLNRLRSCLGASAHQPKVRCTRL